MITIDDHTFNEKLIDSGWIIDAGCRGFNFSFNFSHSRQMKSYPVNLDPRVLSLDIENFNDIPNGVKFKHAALSHKSGEIDAYYFGNGTANFLKGLNGEPGNSEERPVETKKVQCITLQDIYNEIGTDIDLLKLDIEGSEYEILENIEPIPKQITVEFHEHVHNEFHKKYIDKVMIHLCKYYHCNLHIREWPLYHYMDCLFIRKDLL